MKFLGSILLCLAFSMPAWAENTKDMVDAAHSFLNSLNDQQKENAALDWNSKERTNWHFVPRVRAGLPLKEMTIYQQQLAFALLSTGMSSPGMKKSFQIMVLEQVLHELENNAPHRDPSLYYIAVFGTPGMDGTWGWRVEGHHSSVNFTLSGAKVISSTPLFMGANPHKVLDGPHKGLRVLGAEEDLARKIINSLNDEQRKAVLISAEAPRDIFTGAQPRVDPLAPDGLPVSAMTEAQAKMVFELIKEYIYRVRPVFAERDILEIEESLEDITFAWAGKTTPGEAHYYRVQGPTFLLEYDNIQNNNNHSHTVWRDFNGDFGMDILKKHYEEDHQ